LRRKGQSEREMQESPGRAMGDEEKEKYMNTAFTRKAQGPLAERGEPGAGSVEPSDRSRSGGAFWAFDRLVGDGVEPGAAGVRTEVETVGFGTIERAGAAAAEDGELVAGFVDGAVAVDAFGDGEGRAVGVGGGD
jgi:hypothetical protein